MIWEKRALISIIGLMSDMDEVPDDVWAEFIALTGEVEDAEHYDDCARLVAQEEPETFDLLGDDLLEVA